jgi:integrase
MATREVTKHQGVYRREIQGKLFKGKPDICFDITYKADGKKVWEKVGLFSEGYSERLAADIRAERMRSIRHGDELPKQKKKASFFRDAWGRYSKWAETNKARGGKEDVSRYTCHLEKRLGSKRLNEISSFGLERLKSELLKEGLSPATVKHCLVLIRQIFNKAVAWGLHQGPNPVRGVKMPSVQNQKTRFLSHEEASLLLSELGAMKATTLHDMALLSLYTGLRAGEIFNLKGYDLDFQNDLIRITDPKNKTTRHAYMAGAVKGMLEHRKPDTPEGLVFPGRTGKKAVAVSQNFRRIVNRMGFNRGITDRRQQITFHSLRHTYASWLALQGESLITIRDLLGHKTTQMTERYSHLVSDHKRAAAKKLENDFNGHSKSEAAVNEK